MTFWKPESDADRERRRRGWWEAHLEDLGSSLGKKIDDLFLWKENRRLGKELGAAMSEAGRQVTGQKSGGK